MQYQPEMMHVQCYTGHWQEETTVCKRFNIPFLEFVLVSANSSQSHFVYQFDVSL